MLKPANLQALVSQLNHSNADARQYLANLGNTTIRQQELVGIEKLVHLLPVETSALQAVYVGYSVPKLSKEFDLLLFGANNQIINVELKSDAHYAAEKVRKQLVNHKYYLMNMSDNLSLYTYNSDANRVYTLQDDDTLESVSTTDKEALSSTKFYQDIIACQPITLPSIDQAFNPDQYLVSPLAQLTTFLSGQYHLPHHQQLIQSNILAVKHSGIFAMNIASSTGKNLMLYDTVKLLQTSHRVLIVQIGSLNSGQSYLRRIYGWQILPERQFFKKIKNNRLAHFDVIFIDDAQRLSVKHANLLMKHQVNQHLRVYLLGDVNQKERQKSRRGTFFESINQQLVANQVIELQVLNK